MLIWLYRCSEYRGSTVPFTSCLNLTRPQFSIGGNQTEAQSGSSYTRAPFKPTLGPQPVVAPRNYRPAVPSRQFQAQGQSVSVLQNPARAAARPGNGAPMQYGNAAKGIRAAQPAGPAVGHQDRLASLLAGQFPPRHGGQHAGHAGHHVAHVPRAHAVPPVIKSPKQGHAALAAGHPAAAATSGSHKTAQPSSQETSTRGRGRGGGGFRGGRGGERGRGRGRGGAPSS